jgi:hypothetical protein
LPRRTVAWISWFTSVVLILTARELADAARWIGRVPKVALAFGTAPFVLLTYWYLTSIQTRFFSALGVDPAAVGMNQNTVMGQPLAGMLFLVAFTLAAVVLTVAFMALIAAVGSAAGVRRHRLPRDRDARKRVVYAAADETGRTAIGPLAATLAVLALALFGVLYLSAADDEGRLVADGYPLTGASTTGLVDAEAHRVTVIASPPDAPAELSEEHINDCMLYLGRGAAGLVLYDVLLQRPVTLPSSQYSLALIHDGERVENRCLQGRSRPG